ncbi:MAG: hypothetical protein ABSE57_18455 [Bryobacteraceae bacterium]
MLPRFSIVTCLILAVALAGCNKSQDQAAQNQPADVSNGDPANGNLAAADQSGDQAAGDQSAVPPEPAPAAPDDAQDASYQQPVQASQPPPPLPVYSQPPAPGDNYIWTPGYWSYANAGYYWVPGAWILAPYVGALWTPPWWGFDDGYYHWHSGYWGQHIGYYGGINYGFGYTGRGYYGAYWNNGAVYYNRTVTNVNVSIVHNVYNYNVPNNQGSRVSFNGGRGGIDARPTAQELAAAHDSRTLPVRAQGEHAREASSNRAQFAAPDGRAPAALVAPRPIATEYHAPAARPPVAAAIRTPAHSVPERPAEAPRAPEIKPVPQPARQPEQAQHPAAPARPEVRREEPRPAAPSRPEPQARPESRPAAPPRPAPKPKEEEHKEH